MSKNYVGGVNWTGPTKGDTNWDGNEDAGNTKLSAHNHTGSGNGAQLTAAAFAADALNGTVFRLSNSQPLRARNAANSGDISLLQLDANDTLELMRVARFSSTETLTGSGAISVTTSLTLVNSAGSTTLTLAAGREGQLKVVVNIGAGTSTITGIGSVPASGGCLVLFYTGTGWRAVRTLKGTTTNDDALTGEVGEVLRTTRVASAGTALTTGVTANIANPTSITLTPGDWDVRGAVGFSPAATTNVTNLVAAVSKTSATLPSTDTTGVPTAGEYIATRAQAASVPVGSITLEIPSFRTSVSANTSLFLVGRATFTVSTMSGYGFLEARRVR